MIEDVLGVIGEAIIEVVGKIVGEILSDLFTGFSIDFLNRESSHKSFFSDEIISLDIFSSNKENL